MDFDLLLGGDALFDEEERDVLSEVSLQLDDHTLLLVLDNGAVAMEHLLEGAKQFLVVQIIGQTLDDGDALTHGTLLVMQIYNTKRG